MDSLLDDQTKRALSMVREGLEDGQQVANFFASKMLLVRRRFIETIIRLIDSDFFSRSEAHEPFAGFQADSFRNTVAAAYDLRSKYVHTGVPFGHWIALGGGMNNEVQLGQPVIDDKELSKIIFKAPTFIGLERIIRYSLLRFAQLHGIYVES